MPRFLAALLAAAALTGVLASTAPAQAAHVKPQDTSWYCPTC